MKRDKTLTIRISDDLRTQAKAKAEKEGKNITQVIHELLVRYVSTDTFNNESIERTNSNTYRNDSTGCTNTDTNSTNNNTYSNDSTGCTNSDTNTDTYKALEARLEKRLSAIESRLEEKLAIYLEGVALPTAPNTQEERLSAIESRLEEKLAIYLEGVALPTAPNTLEKRLSAIEKQIDHQSMLNNLNQKDISELQDQMKGKTDQNSVDKAIEPVWDSINYVGDQLNALQNLAHSQENTPTESPLEGAKEDAEDKSPAREDERLNEKNKEERLSAIGLSTSELEKKLGIPSSYISKWKNGKSLPSEGSKNWGKYQEFLNWGNEGTDRKPEWVRRDR